MKRIYRFELKYDINPRQGYLLEKEIRKFGMKPDPNIISGTGEYFVTSLYYDSHDLSDYKDKAGGFLKKKKIRARIYEPYLDKSGFVWLEIKHRFGAQNTKTRVKLSRPEFDKFIENKEGALTAKDWGKNVEAKNDILWNFIKTSAKPRIVVRYKRKAFMSDTGDLRITFDSDLETCQRTDLNCSQPMLFVNHGRLVMEIKFCYLIPSWLKVVINDYGLKADTYSKYEKSSDSLRRYNPFLR